MMSAVTTSDDRRQVSVARTISRMAVQRWGDRRPTVLIGQDPHLVEALERTARYAASDGTVLVTGETGTGKELFARALYLLSQRSHRPYLAVNCAQFQDGQLMASELFGHKRGSFTGAVADHRGVFEEAEGGVVFLDEIGELSPGAQAMLLRTLSEGEVVPVGATHARAVDVRVIAATSRDLKPMVQAGTFRADLYYRLKCFHLHVPPVRERGSDWELISDHYLERAGARAASRKRFSTEAWGLMREYHWPGNVRELKSVVDTGYHLATGEVIEARDFAERLEMLTRDEQLRKIPTVSRCSDAIARMTVNGESFWEVVHRPFMDRELSRVEAREIIAEGLYRTRGSYKKLLELFRVSAEDYLKFMDFLRHQKLKPD